MKKCTLSAAIALMSLVTTNSFAGPSFGDMAEDKKSLAVEEFQEQKDLTVETAQDKKDLAIEKAQDRKELAVEEYEHQKEKLKKKDHKLYEDTQSTTKDLKESSIRM